MIINVTKSFLPNINKYNTYVEKIYSSGWLTNNGQLVQTLTERLENYLGIKNLLLVNNATIGLQVAYRALELTGEVITTPFSFVATLSSLVWERLKPIFVDIDATTLCLDVNRIKPAINKQTSAILPVHVYGNVCAVEMIQEIAESYNLKVIYDAAHAFGIQYKNKSVLQWGDIAVLSFHATKLFHTIEGGALIVNNNDYYNIIKEMLNFGFDQNGGINRLGTNAKMSEFHAAMGLCVLDDLEFIMSKRQLVDQYYRQNLHKNLILSQTSKEATVNYAYFPIIFESESQLISVMNQLNEKNIYPRRYFYPSLNTLQYVDYAHMPFSEAISKKILCLPLYADLEMIDAEKICDIVNRVFA